MSMYLGYILHLQNTTCQNLYSVPNTKVIEHTPNKSVEFAFAGLYTSIVTVTAGLHVTRNVNFWCNLSHIDRAHMQVLLRIPLIPDLYLKITI